MSEAGGSPPPGPRSSQSRGSQHPKPPSRSRSLEQRPVGLPASLPPRPPHVPPRAHTGLSLPGPSDVAEREQCDVLSALLAGIKTQQRNKKTH